MGNLKFAYFMFSMEYNSAVQYAKFLEKEEDYLHAHAALFGMTSSDLIEEIRGMSKHLSDKETFLLERKRLCEMPCIFSALDPQERNLAFILARAAFGRRVMLEDDGVRFFLDFGDCKNVWVWYDERDDEAGIILDGVNIISLSKGGKAKFKVPREEICIPAYKINSPQGFVLAVAWAIVDEVTNSPIRFAGMGEDNLDMVRVFNALWSEDTSWLQRFVESYWYGAGHVLSRRDRKALERFATHPDIETYEDADGILYYVSGDSARDILLVVEKKNGEYVVSDPYSPICKRWKMLEELSS